LRRLWLLHPVERRKGRPGAHVGAWWSASEVLVLAGAAELPGVSRARLGCRQRAYDPRGEQEHQRLYRAWRSGHSRIIQVCPAPACQMRHRPGATIRSRLGATLSKNDARATSSDAASDRSRIVLVKRPGTITADAACRTGGSPSHHFGRAPNPKIRPYSKNTAYSPRRINPATDRMRSTNAQIWIRHFRYAADRSASGR
jgi:hypothetical protein